MKQEGEGVESTSSLISNCMLKKKIYSLLSKRKLLLHSIGWCLRNRKMYDPTLDYDQIT